MNGLLLCMLFVAQAFALDSLEMRMSEARLREQDAKTKIAQLDAAIVELRLNLERERENTATKERTLFAKAGVRKEDIQVQWGQIAVFIRQMDSLALQSPLVVDSLRNHVKWAEERWSFLKTFPVMKLMRTDTLGMQAQQGLLRLRRNLEELQTRLAAEAAALAARPAPEPEPVVEVAPPPPPVAVVPPPPPPPEPIPEKSTFDGKVYRVGKASDRKDGTLWEISAIVYGDPQKWQRLWRANKDRIKNPDRIVPGMVLVVPAGPVPKK